MDGVRFVSSEDTYPLRLDVLWPHLDELYQCKIDVDEWPETFHVGVFENEMLVAVGTFLVQRKDQFEDQNQYRLRAMASSPEFRGRNFGRKLIDFAREELKTRQVDVLWCDAREVAFGFYEKMGFKSVGEFYEIPKIGLHKLMYYRLK